MDGCFWLTRGTNDGNQNDARIRLWSKNRKYEYIDEYKWKFKSRCRWIGVTRCRTSSEMLSARPSIYETFYHQLCSPLSIRMESVDQRVVTVGVIAVSAPKKNKAIVRQISERNSRCFWLTDLESHRPIAPFLGTCNQISVLIFNIIRFCHLATFLDSQIQPNSRSFQFFSPILDSFFGCSTGTHLQHHFKQPAISENFFLK